MLSPELREERGRRLIKLIERLEPDQVRMRYILDAPWVEDEADLSCQTVACVAGWTCVSMEQKRGRPLHRSIKIAADVSLHDTHRMDRAKKWLGLGAAARDRMFGVGRHQDLQHDDRISKRVVVNMLETWIRTGRVRWRDESGRVIV